MVSSVRKMAIVEIEVIDSPVVLITTFLKCFSQQKVLSFYLIHKRAVRKFSQCTPVPMSYSSLVDLQDSEKEKLIIFLVCKLILCSEMFLSICDFWNLFFVKYFFPCREEKCGIMLPWLQNFCISTNYLGRDSHLHCWMTKGKYGLPLCSWVQSCGGSKVMLVNCFVFFYHIFRTMVCWDPEILLPWQCDITTAPIHYNSPFFKELCNILYDHPVIRSHFFFSCPDKVKSFLYLAANPRNTTTLLEAAKVAFCRP